MPARVPYGYRRVVRMKPGDPMYAPKKKSPVKRLAKTTRKAVASIAKSVFKRNTETKYLAAQVTASTAVEIYGDTVPSGGPAQVYAVMPEVPQSTTTANEYTREGVKINPTKLEVDLDLYFNNTRPAVGSTGGSPLLDTVAWDIDVHIWYGYVRKYKQNGDIVANSTLIAENLLDVGDGTTQRWSGSPIDHQLKINKEYMVGMKHKVVRMSRPLGEQNVATASGGITTYFPQKINKSLKLFFKTPKTLLFNEANVDPENYAPVVIIGYQHNDFTQASNTFIAAGLTPADVLKAPAIIACMKSHLWFKDA